MKMKFFLLLRVLMDRQSSIPCISAAYPPGMRLIISAVQWYNGLVDTSREVISAREG